MQGIVYAQYKLVEEYINKLQEGNQANIYYPSNEIIFNHKETLTEIYKNYREAFQQMTIIINQFEAHKQAVKRLIILQKKKNKQLCKAQSKQSKLQLNF